MPHQPIRIAIAGTGNIARIHAEALRTVNRGDSAGLADIVAAADIDASRLAAFRREHRIRGSYRDLGEMLRATRPDLVHVCTPPWLHHEQALACLRAGASVLVEKPPTVSLRDFDELARAEGGGAGPWFATVFQHRFGSGQRRLAALAAAGILGRPLLAICHTTWFRDQAYFDVPWRGRWDTEGGGPTMGHGIHQMDMLLDVLGDWTQVSAVVRRQVRRTQTEDLSLAHVTFRSGAVASVVNSVLSPREESYLRFDFERATAEVTHVYGYGDDDWRVTPAPGYEEEILDAWKHGERPVTPDAGARALAGLQERIVAASRFGIPAVAHEECLTGFSAWTATAFPTPLAWGAAFDSALVRAMAGAIARSMRAVGVHQGLAPVLDVARDPRWGRVEETIGEDPYLVGVIGTAYVEGLQSEGVNATLKHFAGYAASRAGRNMAPVGMGPREFADVILPPFEMAIRLGGARSVMPSYADLDGMPPTGDGRLLTEMLRDELGFDGVVVSDYYAISFLETQHGVAGTSADAAAIAVTAGVDVELPSVRCYGEPLATAVRDGRVDPDLVDRAVTRVLRQKCDLGMFDPGWSAVSPAIRANGTADGTGGIDLDPPASRSLARQLAEESVILLANDTCALPLDPVSSIAVVGPLADDPLAFFGCYTMPRHLGPRYPEAAEGLAVTPVLGALRAELPAARISHARGCDVRSADGSGIAAAVDLARAADVVVAVLGDEAGLFGKGTSGEGCDAADLRLPGVQDDLLQALADTDTPVILTLITGRPYAIGHVADRLAAVVQAFFPGEEGGGAIAGILSGRVPPSGKLPIEMPRSPAAQPSSYLHPRLAGPHPGSSVDTTPLFAFGHGLSYTSFSHADLTIRPAPGATGDDGYAASRSAGKPGMVAIATDGTVEIASTVRNVGRRPGTEVVQLYLSDPVAQVVRPVRWLAGFARVALDPGQASRVAFRLHADRTAFHGRDRTRIVEPGEILVEVGPSSADLPLRASFTLSGAERAVGSDRVLDTPVAVRELPDTWAFRA